MNQALERQVKADLLLMCQQTSKVVKGYVPHRTLEMLQTKGGLGTLEWMLDSPCQGDGFLKMATIGAMATAKPNSIHPLSLTLEAYTVSHPEVQVALEIQEEVISLIRKKLIELGYDPDKA